MTNRLKPRHPLLRAVSAAMCAAGALTLGLTAGVGSRADSPPAYVVTDLGTLDGNTSNATGINNAGQVIGNTSTVGFAGFRAFLWQNNQMQDLGSLGGPSSVAYAINGLGHVAGRSDPAGGGPSHAFLYRDGVMQDLGTLFGTSSAAAGLNDADDVVGSATLDGDSIGHAFLYDGSSMLDLGAPDGKSSVAAGINAAGQVVGTVNPAGDDLTFEAFIADATGRHPLDTPPGTSTAGYGINASGVVVGSAKAPEANDWHAFLYDNTGLHDLGTLGGSSSDATAINGLGQVVGYSRVVGGGVTHAFLYRDGQMQDLNDLLPSGSSWVLETATGINDNGQIVGAGRLDPGSPPRAFLLTPVGEPHALAPQAPSGLVVKSPPTNQYSQLDLTWTDNSNQETGYEIQRKKGAGDWVPVTVVAASSTSYSDTNLAAYAHYTYRVRAVNAAGPSAWSDEVSGDTGILPFGTGLAGLSFGEQPVGVASDARTLHIMDSGTAPLIVGSIALTGAHAGDFALLSNCAGSTIPPGGQCAMMIVFTPTAAGSRYAVLTITDNTPASPHIMVLSGTGTTTLPATGTAPDISISPGSVSFDAQPVGTSNGTQSIALQNSGGAPLDIRSVTVTGANPGDFTITTDGWTGAHLLPGHLALLSLHFTPTAAGSRSASLTVTDTAAGSPHIVALSGTGTAPAVSLTPGSLTFTEQLVGSTSAEQTITLTNTGDGPLTLHGVHFTGLNASDFAATADLGGAILAPGQSRAITVRFAPTAAGSRTASLAVSDSAADSPHTVTLAGTGTAPTVTFGVSRLGRPTRVSWGDQPVGSTGATQTLTNTNGGTGALTISSVRITGANAADFALAAGSSGPVLAPGASRSFTLRFRPGSKGSRTASLTMSDNAAGSPHTVALQGMGVLIPPPAPAGLEVKVVSYKEIQLMWVPGSPETTSYAIWRKVGSGEFQRYSGVSGMFNRFVDKHVSPNTAYTYRIRANSPGGVSAWSEEVSGTTLPVRPAAPTGLTARALSASQMELSWTDNSSDETSFAIWRKSGAGAWTRVGGVPGGTIRFVDRKLTPNTTYVYRVRSNGPGGVSDWSNEATGKTPAQ
jgi:probable HAF family extracellular repeat protein